MRRRSDPGSRKPGSPKVELPEESEEAIALEFATLRQNDLRYVPTWRAWMIWDGASWRADLVQSVLAGVRTLTRAAADRIIEQDAARSRARSVSVASARWAEAVERLARSDPRLARGPMGWDDAPMLLATPRGVIDLSTGRLRPAEPGDYLTKLALNAPAPNATCPTWLKFLDVITGGDTDLVQYLQRVAGYCLTGETREHLLFFIHGPGRNGKSVFVSTLASILKEHAKTAPMDMLVAAHGERHPTDLAMLRGARLVVAQETEANRPWAASRIKQLTGGDTITARMMRRDFFEFVPQFKLLVVGNHLPTLGRLDPALCARIQVIPFLVTIPQDKRDKRLAEKLLREAPGILRWAIAGCLEWQRNGLQPPEAVLNATRAYVHEADIIERWLGECCGREIGLKTGSSSLYESWSRWATAIGQPCGSHKAFSENLTLRGFQRCRLTGGTAGFLGLRLLRT